MTGKHRGEPKPELPAVIIETTDTNARVLRAPTDGSGVLFVPPGIGMELFSLDCPRCGQTLHGGECST